MKARERRRLAKAGCPECGFKWPVAQPMANPLVVQITVDGKTIYEGSRQARLKAERREVTGSAEALELAYAELDEMRTERDETGEEE